MANERLQGEEQYHSKNYLLEMPRSHAKKPTLCETNNISFSKNY